MLGHGLTSSVRLRNISQLICLRSLCRVHDNKTILPHLLPEYYASLHFGGSTHYHRLPQLMTPCTLGSISFHVAVLSPTLRAIAEPQAGESPPGRSPACM